MTRVLIRKMGVRGREVNVKSEEPMSVMRAEVRRMKLPEAAKGKDPIPALSLREEGSL